MEVSITGLDEILQKLTKLPLEEADENRAVNKAANVVKKAIQEEAPEDTGMLKNNIKVKRAKEGVAKIHTGRAFHGHLVEFGRSGGYKMAKKNGKTQKVTWGPTAPNPFFTRGYEKSKEEAKQVMAEEIKKVLNI